jgi:hypothetical protein
MTNLILHVKKKYFDEVKAGTKKEEYREYKDYWIKRLVGKDFRTVTIQLGYSNQRLVFPYKGYRISTIKHLEFAGGQKAVPVFIIPLERL